MNFSAINTIGGTEAGINRSIHFDTITSISMKFSKFLLLALFAIIATSIAEPEPEPEAFAEPEALAEPEPEAFADAEPEPEALGK